MKKRILFVLSTIVCSVMLCSHQLPTPRTGEEERRIWVETMIRIVDPVLRNTAEGTLKKNMPYQSPDTLGQRRDFAYLEAFGRTICGIAPWLESDCDEAELKQEYRQLTRKALANAVDPKSPDYMTFDHSSQPLVDAAYLAQGLLRAPVQLWGQLDMRTRDNVIAALKLTRRIKPGQNNWLLFASTVEAAILEFTGQCDTARMLYGVKRFRDDFYKGDAMYGDGAAFHMDYYNSYVIHPMLLDVLRTMERHGMSQGDFLAVELKRHTRYAEILERFIAPDGTYPVLGRSISACRFGAFHALSQSALLGSLPKSVCPSQVRAALTAVIERQTQNPANFDQQGWMKVGFAGDQPEMAERYVNTGSLYHCTTVFLALGLPSTDPFWSDPFAPWTNLKAWNGDKIAGDHAIKN